MYLKSHIEQFDFWIEIEIKNSNNKFKYNLNFLLTMKTIHKMNKYYHKYNNLYTYTYIYIT